MARIEPLPKAGDLIEMTGRLIEGSMGYGAERARIVEPVEVSVPDAACGTPAGANISALAESVLLSQLPDLERRIRHQGVTERTRSLAWQP